MRKLLIMLLSVITLFVTPMCTSSKKANNTIEQAEKPISPKDKSIQQVEVFIEQHGKIIKPSKGRVVLDKTSFNLIFEFPQPMAVVVNTAFDDLLLEQAAEGQFIVEREQFSLENMIAVELFNPDRLIFVSGEASSPMFYEGEEEHNFNKVEIKNGKYRCTRTVETIFDVDAGIRMGIENINTPIYLVFAPTTDGIKMTSNIAIKSNYLTIEWKE
ncbi:MAG: hypothetical protein R2753_05985 [Chitinophagales bacterium]